MYFQKFSDKLPDSVDVVIIGGGAIGIFSALFINRTGLKVAVLEKGYIACEQSSRNWGWIRTQGRDIDEIPIVQESIQLWEKINKELDGKIGFKKHGTMYLASNKKTLEKRRKWLEIAKDFNIKSEEITRTKLAEMFNTSKTKLYKDWIGAIYTASDAKAEPQLAIPKIAELAQKEGVIIIENCAVRTLEIIAGKLNAVNTELGVIKTSQAVLAAGAWSSLFLARHGISIPQLSVCASVLQTGPLSNIWQGNSADEKLSFRRRDDKGYTLALPDFIEVMIGIKTLKYMPLWQSAAKNSWQNIKFRRIMPTNYPDSLSIKKDWDKDDISPFEKTRILDPKPSSVAIKKIQDRFAKRFFVKEKIKVVKTWAGMIDAMPDVVPIVDYAPNIEGLIIATGMSGHGFGASPGFGKIISQLASQQEPSHDIKRFRFKRFTDNSKLKVGPGI
jgi:glycine/D-amino acid oxidase-like deaminating enzyme